MKGFASSCILVLFLFLINSGLAQDLIDSYSTTTASTSYGTTLSADADGNLFLYGHFDQLNGEYVGKLAKLDSNGKQVESFNQVITDDAIRVLKFQRDGKILIAGSFTKINGNPAGHIIRLNKDGSVDKSFNCDVGFVGLLELQSNGKIVAFVNNSSIVRLNTDGTKDMSFSFSEESYIQKLAIDSEDNIYCMGSTKIDKLNPDGGFDDSFTSGTVNGQFGAMTIMSDKKILLGGFFTTYNGMPASSIIRLSLDGRIDAGFDVGAGPNSAVYNIVERADKNILIGGTFNRFNDKISSLVELKPDGSVQKEIAFLDYSWITGIIDFPDGTFTITGPFQFVNAKRRFSVAKFDKNYALDDAFIPVVTFTDPNSRLIEVIEDGVVITGGGNNFLGIINNQNLISKNPVALNSYGGYNNSFNSPLLVGQADVYAMHRQPDGKILLSGYFGSGKTLIRINEDGSKDATFNSGSGASLDGNTVGAHALEQWDDKIYVGGNFDKFDTRSSNSLVALALDGTIAKTYDALPVHSAIYSIQRQSGGKLIVYGDFPGRGNGSRTIIRLNADGTIDDSFNEPSVGGLPNFMRIDASDRIYLGGDIYTFNDLQTNYTVIRILPDGGLDTSFDTGSGFAGQQVRSLELLPDNKIAMGGWFTTYRDQVCNGFVITDENGTLIPSPKVLFGKGTVVETMKYRNGSIYLAGRFVKNDYSNVFGNARILVKPVPLPAAPDEVTISLESASVFKIGWKDRSDNELAFVVERLTEGESMYVAIDTLSANTTSKIDNNRLPFKKYTYRVRAIGASGGSTYSAADFTWKPLPSGEFTLAGFMDKDANIQLRWGEINYQNGFILERSKGTNNYILLDTIPASINSYSDILPEADTYTYRVTAFNNEGVKVSNVVSIVITGLENDSQSLVIYPNPAKDIFFVKMTGIEHRGKWEMTNTLGQLFPLSGKLSADHLVFDIHHLPAGLYIVRYINDKNVFTFRLNTK